MCNNGFFTHSNEPEKGIKLSEKKSRFLFHADINKDLNQRREKEWKSDFCFEAFKT